MSKREQALKIEPKNEIHFKGPYNRVVTEYFKLTNPTERPIAFKVKTTAPKRYCVRPNNGTIAPGKNVQVAVMLQPHVTGEQPSALEKNKHKFMIQAVFVATETGNADDLFKSVGPDEIMDSKFRCVFDDFPNAAAPTGHPAGSDSDDNLVGGDKTVPDTYSSSKYNDHSSEPGSGPASLSTAPTVQEAFVNGTEEESSRHLFSAPTSATAPSHGESSGETVVKQLRAENVKLQQKVNELMMEASQNRGPHNRFASAGGQAQAQAKASQVQQQAGLAGLFDQLLTGQYILTVLISLLVGFILGKLDLGF